MREGGGDAVTPHTGLTTQEEITVTFRYRIHWQTKEGRAEAMKLAQDGAIDARGVGPDGCYGAERIGLGVTP